MWHNVEIVADGKRREIMLPSPRILVMRTISTIIHIKSSALTK